MRQLPFDAVIFDHDGTLIDTETPDYRACTMLCEEIGLTLTLERWAEMIVGRQYGYDLLFEELIHEKRNGLTTAGLWQRLRELWQVTLENVELMPGVTTLLPLLQQAGYPLAVATAADRAWVTRWLARFELASYFKVVANRDDVANNKPAPDVYLFAAAQLGVSPGRCLVFEDSVAGLQAAKAAGMVVVAVPTEVTRSLNFSAADATVDGLHRVTPAWINDLSKKLRP
jgi:beta-phosphoglucomutase